MRHVQSEAARMEADKSRCLVEATQRTQAAQAGAILRRLDRATNLAAGIRNHALVSAAGLPCSLIN